MSKRQDYDLINDIVESIRRIQLYTGEISYVTFLKDTKTQDAVVRNLEIIGEAAKSISNKLLQQYSTIPWKKLSGTRDRLIHQYFGVNLDIVWSIARQELPNILPDIQKIIKNK